MSQTPRTEPIGLDVGTSRIVAARQTNDEIKYASQLNAFVAIPYSKMTESVLRKENVPHSVDGTEILVHGNESERFADLLKKDVRRTMARGVLNPDEPDNVKLIREITASLTGKAEKGKKLYFTVPAAPLGAEDSLTYHEVTMRRVLSDLGFEATSINEGLAVVYAEMENTNYTGLGISFGGGLCNVCLSYLAVPVLSFSVPKAGDFIDSSAASVTGERPNRIRLMKEQSFFMNGHFESKLQEVLSVYYDDMIESVVSGMQKCLPERAQSAESDPSDPAGAERRDGGAEGFQGAVRENPAHASDFPVEDCPKSAWPPTRSTQLRRAHW